VQLNVTTDYGVRTILHLAQKGGLANRKEICENMGIPISSMPAITKALQNAGIIAEKRGPAGGYILLMNPDDITLGMIVSAFEKTMRLNRCLEDDEYCSRHAPSYCTVRCYLVTMQEAVEEMLSIPITHFI